MDAILEVVPKDTKLYYKQAHCNYTKDDGSRCGMLALKGNLYCRHHATDYTPPAEVKTAQILKRYARENKSVDNLYDRNLQSDAKYSMDDEIAMLQATLQGLYNIHDKIAGQFTEVIEAGSNVKTIKDLMECHKVELAVIDRLERLIKMTKELELKQRDQANTTSLLRLVLSKVIYVINTKVSDTDVKRRIAEDLYMLGQEQTNEGVTKLSTDLSTGYPQDIHSLSTATNEPIVHNSVDKCQSDTNVIVDNSIVQPIDSQVNTNPVDNQVNIVDIIGSCQSNVESAKVKSEGQGRVDLDG